MYSVESLKEIASDAIDSSRTELAVPGRKIWETPELRHQEFNAHDVLTEFLEKHGFKVERKYKLETAFRAEYGAENPGPNIAILCEYDALPAMGHACGHNLIAEAGCAAALGLKAALQHSQKPLGKVTILGTPGEEGGGGKVELLNAGAFEDIDVAMMVHPGVILNGGVRCNIIPDYTELEYLIRAPTTDCLEQLTNRILDCVRGAATSTGCRFEFDTEARSFYQNMITNERLASKYEENARLLGLEMSGKGDHCASSDMGNVSHVVPSIHPVFAITESASNHTKEFTIAAGDLKAQEPTIIQGKAMAHTALDVLSDPELLEAIKNDFVEDLKNRR